MSGAILRRCASHVVHLIGYVQTGWIQAQEFHVDEFQGCSVAKTTRVPARIVISMRVNYHPNRLSRIERLDMGLTGKVHFWSSLVVCWLVSSLSACDLDLLLLRSKHNFSAECRRHPPSTFRLDPNLVGCLLVNIIKVFNVGH